MTFSKDKMLPTIKMRLDRYYCLSNVKVTSFHGLLHRRGLNLVWVHSPMLPENLLAVGHHFLVGLIVSVIQCIQCMTRSAASPELSQPREFPVLPVRLPRPHELLLIPSMQFMSRWMLISSWSVGASLFSLSVMSSGMALEVLGFIGLESRTSCLDDGTVKDSSGIPSLRGRESYLLGSRLQPPVLTFSSALHMEVVLEC